MSVNSYLTNLSSKLILKDKEKESIKTSISTLETRLGYYFDNIGEKFCFGSYTRGTILPRKADEKSDIDYMIVFGNDNDYKPQTFLNYLRNFANEYYSTSEIYQSYPTVVLELNHIKFELVPAYNAGYYFKDYKIPAPSNVYEDWISTDPNGFNDKLTEVNTATDSKIKSIIRLIKYWNAKNGYVYSSYLLEEQIINTGYYWCESMKEYFSTAVENLPTHWSSLSQTSQNKINRFKENVKEIMDYDSNRYPNTAESKLADLLPDIN